MGIFLDMYIICMPPPEKNTHKSTARWLWFLPSLLLPQNPWCVGRSGHDSELLVDGPRPYPPRSSRSFPATWWWFPGAGCEPPRYAPCHRSCHAHPCHGPCHPHALSSWISQISGEFSAPLGALPGMFWILWTLVRPSWSPALEPHFPSSCPWHPWLPWLDRNPSIPPWPLTSAWPQRLPSAWNWWCPHCPAPLPRATTSPHLGWRQRSWPC